MNKIPEDKDKTTAIAKIVRPYKESRPVKMSKTEAQLISEKIAQFNLETIRKIGL